MPVRFVIGRAGSGKTHRFFHAIRDALRQDPMGPGIYWILPRQATFMAERELTVASGLGGFCRARVLSFDELGSELLAECGGSAVPRITRLGRRLILGHLLRRHESSLRFFSKVARHPGMAARLEASLAEFERCGRDPADFQKLASRLAGDSTADSLALKLHDIHLIYQAYVQYLGQDRLDPRRWMQQVLANILQSNRLKNATVYVDAFSEFDDFERRMLARIGRVCACMEISLLMDPRSPVLKDPQQPLRELSVFHPAEQTYQYLLKAFADENVVVQPPVLLQEVHRFTSRCLGELERCMAEGSSPAHAPPADLTLVEALDRRAEVEHAARHIRSLLAGGLRMRQITVLSRRLDLYADLIDAVFREHDIPYFADMRRKMAHHPLLLFLRAALDIAAHDWDHEAVMMLIKSGLSGLDDASADRLENYVLAHHLRGRVWTRSERWEWRRRWTSREDDEQPSTPGDDSAEMDLLRRGIGFRLAPFLARFPRRDSTQSVRATVVVLYELFTAFGIPQTLADWIARARGSAQHEQAAEHERVWAELIDLFDQMVDVLGDEPITLADFQEILDAGLDTFDLALAPPTVDQVLVGQIDRTRTHAVEAVLLLGINEGIFPCAPPEESILSDQERSELQRHDFELGPTSRRLLLDEGFWAYLAFTRASRHLYLSRSLSDDASRPLAASQYWHRLLTLFPELRPISLPRDQLADPGLISTPRQLLSALLRWARSDADSARPALPGAGPWPALYDWLARHPACDDPLDRLRRLAWKSLAYRNDAALSAPLAAGIFAPPLSARVSQIESFATCPFRHFLRYGLRLEQRDEQDTIAINLDHAFHRILESLIRHLLSTRTDWAGLAPAQSRQLVSAFTFEVGQSLRGEMMLDNARNRYLLDRIQLAVDQLIASQQALSARAGLTAAFGRTDFGTEGAELPPLKITTPGGREVLLCGTIDRIDLLGQQAAFAILDYRLFSNPLNLARAYHGLSLRLLAHLLVFREHSSTLAGRALAPAGAFYIGLLRQLKSVEHPSDAPSPNDPAFHLAPKPRGILDSRYIRAFDSNLACGGSETIAAWINKDGTCGHKRTTDVAEPAEFAALLAHARRQIALLSDRIMEGDIAIHPYRMGNESPCPGCIYRSVCRFDPAVNRYRQIAAGSRQEILENLAAEVPHG